MADDVVALVREKLTTLDTFMVDVKRDLTGLNDRLEKVRQQALSKAPPGGLYSQSADTVGALVARSEAVKNFVTGSVRGAAVVAVPGRLSPVNKAVVTIAPDLKPGVAQIAPVPLADQPLSVVDLIPAVSLSEGSLQFIRQKTPRAIAGIQANEGDLKLEATMGFQTITLTPETLGVWIPVSRQAASDVNGLTQLIESDLLHALRVLEENEVLNGVGADHLTGILPVATAVTVTATDRLDAIAELIASLTAQGITPTGVVLNPADWNGMTTLKADGAGVYLLGSPTQTPPTVLWGVSLALSSAIAAGTVLAGDFQRGASLHYREDANVQISSEHADFFVRNLLAVRAEERVLLAVKQPSFFAKATLPAVTP